MVKLRGMHSLAMLVFGIGLGVFGSAALQGKVQLGSQPAQAAPHELSDISPEGVYMQPCSSWRYEPDVVGYVCAFTERRVLIPDEYDFRDLARRVDALERAIEN